MGYIHTQSAPSRVCSQPTLPPSSRGGVDWLACLAFLDHRSHCTFWHWWIGQLHKIVCPSHSGCPLSWCIPWSCLPPQQRQHIVTVLAQLLSSWCHTISVALEWAYQRGCSLRWQVPPPQTDCTPSPAFLWSPTSVWSASRWLPWCVPWPCLSVCLISSGICIANQCVCVISWLSTGVPGWRLSSPHWALPGWCEQRHSSVATSRRPQSQLHSSPTAHQPPESSHPPTRLVRLPARTNLLLRGHPALPLQWSPSPCKPTDHPLFHHPSLWWLHLPSFLWCLLPHDSIHTLVGAPQVFHTGRRQLISWRHRVLQELQFRAPTSRSPAPVKHSGPRHGRYSPIVLGPCRSDQTRPVGTLRVMMTQRLRSRICHQGTPMSPLLLFLAMTIQHWWWSSLFWVPRSARSPVW